MWDISLKNLQSDETIEYVDRPTMLSCVFAYIWVGLMMLMFIVMSIESILSKESGMLAASLIYVLIALPAIIIILKRLSTRYAITNRGLLIRTGIFTNNIKTVPFKHITSIEVKETILGRILRYANIIIDTSGSGKAIELGWDYVKAAHNVKKLIEKHVGG